MRVDRVHRYVAVVTALATLTLAVALAGRYPGGSGSPDLLTCAAVFGTGLVFFGTHLAVVVSKELNVLLLGEVPAVVGAVLLPTSTALLLVMVASALAHLLIGRRALLPAVFTTASDTLSTAVALVAVDALLGPERPVAADRVLLVALVVGPTMGVLSNLLVCGVIARAEGRPWRALVRQSTGVQWKVTAGATVAGAVLAGLAVHDLLLLVAILPPSALSMALGNLQLKERMRRRMLDRLLLHINELNTILEPTDLTQRLVEAAREVTGSDWCEIREQPPGPDEAGALVPRRGGPQTWIVVERLRRRGAIAQDVDQALTTLAAAAATCLDNAELHGQLSGRATRDALTGLHNRQSFTELLDHEIARAARDGLRVGMLFLDLDQFKHVNDTWGHQAGDELLKDVASRLLSTLRHEDAVARLGGDEFAVLLPGIGDHRAVADSEGRVHAALGRPFSVGGADVLVGGSIGSATFPDDAQDGRQLLHHADMAMFRAKRKERSWGMRLPGPRSGPRQDVRRDGLGDPA